MQVVELTQHEADAVKIFQALGDPTRFRIVHMLLEREELGCAEIQGIFRLSAPGLSYHFRILQDCGLLVVRKEGQFHYFRLQRERLERLLLILSSKLV
ncbi:MAG: metalloregulator ArsR/SmtB family transcription factor [Dehalococcoidia bacterium]|nr:metalloregulator ArsR/SmtB family transcription factor [Dehalococcoidia bacterium]